jgi:hypothetical protein
MNDPLGTSGELTVLLLERLSAGSDERQWEIRRENGKVQKASVADLVVVRPERPQQLSPG